MPVRVMSNKSARRSGFPYAGVCGFLTSVWIIGCIWYRCRSRDTSSEKGLNSGINGSNSADIENQK